VPRRRLLALGPILVAFVMIARIGPFPRPLIIAPAIALAWIVGSRRMTILKVLCAVVLTSAVLVLWFLLLWTTAWRPTRDRQALILRLYDLNCAAPFGAGRDPHEILWLSEGAPFASPDSLLKCRD